MADDIAGPAAPIVSVRPGRNRLPDEDRALQEERRRRHYGHGGGGHQDEHPHGHEDIRDDVSVVGVPKEEMTEMCAALLPN